MFTDDQPAKDGNVDTMAAEILTHASEIVDSLLHATDRCDGCAAQAYVEVALMDGRKLLFCGHHFNAAEVTLLALGARVAVDERERLLIK